MRTTSNEGGDVVELIIDPRHTRRWRGMEAEVKRLRARVAELEADRKRVFDAGYEWAALFKGTPEQGFAALEDKG